jgi:hypothetical protein
MDRELKVLAAGSVLGEQGPLWLAAAQLQYAARART